MRALGYFICQKSRFLTAIEQTERHQADRSITQVAAERLIVSGTSRCQSPLSFNNLTLSIHPDRRPSITRRQQIATHRHERLTLFQAIHGADLGNLP